MLLFNLNWLRATLQSFYTYSYTFYGDSESLLNYSSHEVYRSRYVLSIYRDNQHMLLSIQNLFQVTLGSILLWSFYSIYILRALFLITILVFLFIVLWLRVTLSSFYMNSYLFYTDFESLLKYSHMLSFIQNMISVTIEQSTYGMIPKL